MPANTDALRRTIAFIAEHLRLNSSPFDPTGLRDRLAVVGVSSPEAAVLSKLYKKIGEESGDGGKTAVLVAASAALAAIEQGPPEGMSLRRVGESLGGAASLAAERVASRGAPVKDAAAFASACVTFANGNEEIAKVIFDAFLHAGVDGSITVDPDPNGHGEFRVRLEPDADRMDHIWVFVREPLENEGALERLAGSVLRAGVQAIGYGVLPGGGVAYALAAVALTEEADDDTVTASAARAMIRGLEAPLSVRASRAGIDPRKAIESAIASGSAFDDRSKEFVPATELVDPVPLVRNGIFGAATAACELLQLP